MVSASPKVALFFSESGWESTTERVHFLLKSDISQRVTKARLSLCRATVLDRQPQSFLKKTQQLHSARSGPLTG